MRALWPRIDERRAREPTTPMTSRPAATRCISYQTPGNSICRCGSLASSGRPLAVRRPAMTQLFEPPRRALGRSHSSPAGQSAGHCRACWRSQPSRGPGAAGAAVVSRAGPLATASRRRRRRSLDHASAPRPDSARQAAAPRRRRIARPARAARARPGGSRPAARPAAARRPANRPASTRPA